MMKKVLLVAMAFIMAVWAVEASSLHRLQQDFVGLKFGLFVHFGMGTYQEEDWADADQPATQFNPVNLDCSQWVDGAESAGMSFGCISVKHHCGFCMWDTKTTGYNVMNSPVKRDVLKEFCDELRNRGMKVMFHFSILDLNRKILPRHINRIQDTEFIKSQLRELLTQYGPVTALMIDGWDAPWARISYDDISFEEIYKFIKSIQPDCLVMDLNGAKYPGDALFYSDLKTYEQGAGQRIDGERAWLPSMACDHLQPTWFWKTSFPGMELPSAESVVKENIIPKNEVGCTFILNVAPNRDGLFDDNAMQRLKEIGRIWKRGDGGVEVEETPAPIISTNLAKHRHATGSWSYDYWLHDFANDDDFTTCWIAKEIESEPWLMVNLDKGTKFNTVAITDNADCTLRAYAIDCLKDGSWHEVFSGEAPTQRQVKIHRFPEVEADAVRLRVTRASGRVAIAELGVYNED